MRRVFNALITTGIQFPVIFWFFLGISLYRSNDLVFDDLINSLIFFLMIYALFFIALTVEKYNNFRFTIYLLLPLSLGVMNLFERSWAAQLVLFFSYIILMGLILRKERFSVYYKAVGSDSMKKVARFDTKENAKQLIQNSINRTLKKLSFHVSSEKELLESYLKNRDIQYRINQKTFNDKEYVKKTIPSIYLQKLQNMIDGGFKLTQDKEILQSLKQLQESEIVEVNRLKDFLEIVYISHGKKECLSIKAAYHMNSQVGIVSNFEFSNKPLEKTIVKKEYIEKVEDFKEVEYQKKQDVTLSDIYFIDKIFYFEDINHISRTGKLIIIYKTKEEMTNSATIFFNQDGIEIDKYKNIFNFTTKILDDELRTQLEYSYNEKYFKPQKYFDRIEEQSKSLIRETSVHNDCAFPCTNFGKKIWFGIDDTKGITAYDLAVFSKEYQLIDNDVYTHLDNKEREKLHTFLSIAQLYINSLFVNQEFDNCIILDTGEYLENHEKIENFEKRLKNSNWVKEDYYDNSDAMGRYPTQFAYICYDKQQKEERFVILEDTDWIDRKVAIKFDNSIKERIYNLLCDTI